MPKANAKKKSSAKKSSPPALNPAANADAPTQGSAEALAEFLADAQSILTRDIRPLRADPALAYHNVDIGLQAVAPHEPALAKLPAPFNLNAMKSLRHLALGVIYAAAQVDRSSPGTIRKVFKRAAELRDVLLSAAVAAMKSGILPVAKVRKIIAGKGMRDMAQDCIDLAQLFRDHAADVKGKTAITKAQIDEAALIGDQLVASLKPGRAKARVPDSVKSAVDTRDRMWTLLVTRHREQLRRAGAWLWVDDVDEYVPPLLSGSSKKAKSKPDEKGGAPDGGP
ncbi:MAG: hypothetical protein HUU21_24270 [Polyangiaceae bacterium]|nr:hypothetical protein [Polyangiaceae bacterium]NUQ76667.1 hypothetical protein [Polyangiaceae bacterium]